MDDEGAAGEEMRRMRVDDERYINTASHGTVDVTHRGLESGNRILPSSVSRSWFTFHIVHKTTANRPIGSLKQIL